MLKAIKRARFLIPFLMLLSMLHTTAGALSVTIEKVNSYTKNGKFYLSFRIGGTATVTTVLKNASGKTVVSWQPRDIDTYSDPVLSFGTDYSVLPAGQYTMIVKATLRGTVNTIGILETKINNNPKPTLSFIEEGMFVSSTTGQYMHRFNFNFTVGTGKTVTTQIYTGKGKLLKTYKYTLKNASGTYSYKWDYFPESGLKVGEGDYVIKYRIGDGVWQQRDFTVQF